MLELAQKPVSEIPIKMASSAEQKPFIALINKILATKQSNAEADTSGLEGQIDELVYALYGLTKEERAVVQGAAE